MICKTCGTDISGLSPERTWAPGSTVGIYIDGVGVGAPEGYYHLSCLEFCSCCGEVETEAFLRRNEKYCRLCKRVGKEAVAALFIQSHPANPVGEQI